MTTRAPRDDLVSLLGSAHLGGQPLPREELLSHCMLLLVATCSEPGRVAYAS